MQDDIFYDQNYILQCLVFHFSFLSILGSNGRISLKLLVIVVSCAMCLLRTFCGLPLVPCFGGAQTHVWSRLSISHGFRGVHLFRFVLENLFFLRKTQILISVSSKIMLPVFSGLNEFTASL